MAGDLSNFVLNGKKIIGVTANFKALLKILERPIPETPGVFLKPTTSYITEPQTIIIPKGFSVNQEIELGIIIGRKGKHIKEDEALNYVGGYCVALDMTATCQMKEARSKGGSWSLGKGFDTACPVSKFIPKTQIPNPHNIELWSSINGKVVQTGNTSDFVFQIPYLISHVSKYFTLEPSDLIITGTPPGMSQVHPNDIVEGGIKDLVTIKYQVKAD